MIPTPAVPRPSREVARISFGLGIGDVGRCAGRQQRSRACAAHVGGGGGGRICGRVGPSPPPRWTTGDPDKVRAASAEMEKQAVDFVIQAPPTNIYNIHTNSL